MTKQTPQEIIFGLIAEEMFPPPSKPTPTPAPVTAPYDRKLPEDWPGQKLFQPQYLQAPIRRTVPLRLLEARVTLSRRYPVRMDAEETAQYVNSEIARGLVKELTPLLDIQCRDDFQSDAVVYRAQIYVAPPKEINGRKSVDVLSWDDIKRGAMT